MLERLLAQQRLAVARREQRDLPPGSATTCSTRSSIRVQQCHVSATPAPGKAISLASELSVILSSRSFTVKGSCGVADFLEEKRKEIQARLKELKPLVEEYHRLEAAERALAGVEASPPARARRRPAPAAPRGGAARQGPSRPAEGLGHARAAGARAGPRAPRHHDPRARGGDGDQAELPLPRDARRSRKRGRW